MGKNGRTRANEAVTDVIEDVNFTLSDTDFDGTIEEPYVVPDHPNTSQVMDRLVKDFSEDEKDLDMSGVKDAKTKGITHSIIAYLKRNVIFLCSIFLMWLILGVEHSFNAYQTPIFGGLLRIFNKPGLSSILRFFTATYNGPMSFGDFMKPTLYGYMVALVAKPIYLLAMTGVIIPSIKGFFKKNSNMNSAYKDNAKIFAQTFNGLLKEINHLGLALMGTGIALMFSNFLTRNGKIDKGFVPILLAVVILLGLKGPTMSLLNVFVKKFISLIINIIPNGKLQALNKARLIQVGCIVGFGLSIITGNLGEQMNYILGIVAFLTGILITLFIKEKRSYEYE